MCYFPSSSAAPSTVESEIILCALLSIPLLLSLDLQHATHSNREAKYLFLGLFFCGTIPHLLAKMSHFHTRAVLL